MSKIRQLQDLGLWWEQKSVLILGKERLTLRACAGELYEQVGVHPDRDSPCVCGRTLSEHPPLPVVLETNLVQRLGRCEGFRVDQKRLDEETDDQNTNGRSN